MTDQPRIPLPPQDEQSQPRRRSERSLFERAVNAFDLGVFKSPPAPRDLAPPVPKPAARRRAEQQAKPVRMRVPAAFAQPEGVAAPHEQAAPAPQPLETQPSLATQPPPSPPPPPMVEAPAAPPPEPVAFTEKRLPVDRQRLRDHAMIVPEGAVTKLLEEFRIVKRQLLLHAADLRGQGAGAAAQRVLVSSPHSGEGKTYCAVNLALSIAAEKESEVLLVDADFANPSVLSMLGLAGGPGLMDALADPNVDVADFVLGTDIPGLWVLPAGEATNSDTEFLSSSRTASVLNRLTEGAPHRMMIFDSPPALAASPVAELAKYVGQALVIVRAESTAQSALDDAISLLSGCPNIQLLLNGITFSPSGRRFGGYYGQAG